MDKAALRSRIRDRRGTRTADDRRTAAEAIAARGVAFLPKEPGDITCFISVAGEPGTGPLIVALLERGHRLWLPRISGHQLIWVQVDGATSYLKGPMGIAEPEGEGTDSLDFADVVLMPAMAVDARGRRLGQGGGFFDRALATVPPLAEGGPMLVAIVHDDEVVDEVPVESHDHAVDAIVTPLRTLRTGATGAPGAPAPRAPG